jgi:hypothetical protein
MYSSRDDDTEYHMYMAQDGASIGEVRCCADDGLHQDHGQDGSANFMV